METKLLPNQLSMKLTLTVFLAIVCKFTFGQKASQIMFPPPVLGMEYPEFIRACDLPTHKKELVYTRFIYSGAMNIGVFIQKKIATILMQI